LRNIIIFTIFERSFAIAIKQNTKLRQFPFK
jgi:hypothetical protein